jgi:hypothetical protein
MVIRGQFRIVQHRSTTGIQPSPQIEVPVIDSDVLSDVVQGVVDCVTLDLLTKVAEDEVMWKALQGCPEVHVKLFQGLGRAGLDDNYDIFCPLESLAGWLLL